MVYLDLVFRRMVVFMKAIFVYIVVNTINKVERKDKKERM